MPTSATRVMLDYLGCKVNQAEVEEIGAHFREAGYVLAAAGETPDVYILNSCTVTHVADRKTRLLIHQMAHRQPRPLIVVTGCYPTIDPGGVTDIDGVDIVVANSDKGRLVDLVRAIRPPLGAAAAPPVASVLARTRAMLKVEDGCDHTCTYCIVPAARGPVHSVPPQVVLQYIRRLVDQGFKEVVLTGVALGSYGAEWSAGSAAPALTSLVESILRHTALPRLRLSSIEPENVDPALFRLLGDPRLCRHLHLPLQSGADSVLKRMGRRYRTEEYAALVRQARSFAPDVAITTDIITGFPGETEEEAASSLAFARAMMFAKIHVFRFSARRGTPATRLPQPAPEAIKKERAARFAELSDESGRAFRRSLVGTAADVLWEEPWRAAPADSRQWWTGFTGNYVRVYAESNSSLHNQITRVTLLSEMADGLQGCGGA